MKKLLAKFIAEEDGAAMVEYSILIGLITALVIGLIAGVGLWVQGEWTDLSNALGIAPAGGGAGGA